MNLSSIKEAITPAIEARGLFLVDANLSKDNDIILTIESQEGEVCLEDCEAVDHEFASLFSRDEEDYSLTVTSAGLNQPFRILRQFVKAVGSDVEVSLKGGRKFVARLTDVSEDGNITLVHTVLETVEGKKKKQAVEKTEIFSLSEQVNSVRPYIDMSKY